MAPEYAACTVLLKAGNVAGMESGEYINLPSAEVYLTDTGGDRPLMILVHGLGAAHTSWMPIHDALARSFRVITPDLPGHGYSPPASHHGLELFADVITELVDRCDTTATLVGNSMGGLVSELAASRRPDLVAHLVLIAPASPPDLTRRPAHLGVAARLLVQSTPVAGTLMALGYRKSRSAEAQAMELLELVAADADQLSDTVVSKAMAMAELRRTMPWSIQAVVQSAASVRSHLIRKKRFASMIDAIEIPALILNGELDKVVEPHAIERLAAMRPDWIRMSRPDLGHVPQLEDPDWVIEQITTWTSTQEKKARAT